MRLCARRRTFARDSQGNDAPPAFIEPADRRLPLSGRRPLPLPLKLSPPVERRATARSQGTSDSRKGLVKQHSHPGLRTPRCVTKRRDALCDKGRGGGRLVLERGRDDLARLVVAREAVDARLDENEAELGVLVLAELAEVGPDGDGLLDEAVEVLRELRGHAGRLEDPEDLVAGQEADLR